MNWHKQERDHLEKNINSVLPVVHPSITRSHTIDIDKCEANMKDYMSKPDYRYTEKIAYTREMRDE